MSVDPHVHDIKKTLTVNRKTLDSKLSSLHPIRLAGSASWANLVNRFFPPGPLYNRFGSCMRAPHGLMHL